MAEETTGTTGGSTGTGSGGSGGTGGSTGTGTTQQSGTSGAGTTQTKPPAASGGGSKSKETASQQTVIQMSAETLSAGIAQAIAQSGAVPGAVPPPSTTEAKPKNLDESPAGGQYIIGDEVKDANGKTIGHVSRNGNPVLHKKGEDDD
jgi:hypothetical protein